MRIRTLKPEWLEDEKIVLAGSDARVLSIALILLADDYGNGRANPLIMGSRIFPSKPGIFVDAIRKLADIGFVQLYTDHEQEYYHVRNWERHQKISKPGKPHVPPPDSINTDPQESPEKIRENNNSPDIPEIPTPGPKDQDLDQDPDPACAREVETLFPDTHGWLKVIKAIDTITAQLPQLEPHRHQEDAESIWQGCQQLDPQNPGQAVERVVTAWWADDWVKQHKPAPAHLAKYITKYANGSPQLNQDKLTDLKRLIRETKQDIKLYRNMGDESTAAKAEARYQKLKTQKQQLEGAA